MITKLDKTASKYAKAYINVFLNEITESSCQNLIKVSNFLNNNKSFYAHLCIPHLSFNEKQKFIDKLAEAFKLTKDQHKLMSLLLLNKKIGLLRLVAQKIMDLFNQSRGIVRLNVYTSHSVNEAQKHLISNFIKNKLKLNAIIDLSINKKLICGIKIKGQTFIWEKSVIKYLNDIKKKDILQVEL